MVEQSKYLLNFVIIAKVNEPTEQFHNSFGSFEPKLCIRDECLHTTFKYFPAS